VDFIRILEVKLRFSKVEARSRALQCCIQNQKRAWWELTLVDFIRMLEVKLRFSKVEARSRAI